MILKTLRFGEIEIEKEQIITFPWGLPGFPEVKKYTPLHYGQDDSLFFLQAVDMPELTFIMADPFQIISNYVVDIPEDDLEALKIENAEEVSVYVILTIQKGGSEITANLMAPLVINNVRRLGRQVILTNSPYNSRHPLRDEPQTAAK